jgi:hypothetical protein
MTADIDRYCVRVTATTTHQLRRYVIVDDEMAAFTDWLLTRMIPARARYGFSLEFAYVIEASNEFVWSLKFEGDAEAAVAADQAFERSPERTAALDGVPNRVVSIRADIVDAAF